MSNTLLLALIPLALFSLAWVGYCWYDIARSDVKHLPKWAWALIVVLSVPVGGIAYLLIGREQN
ncbi:MAG: PLD nuclease N-terminal domain-containing protein [Acidimicrobiia bacterium]